MTSLVSVLESSKLVGDTNASALVVVRFVWIVSKPPACSENVTRPPDASVAYKLSTTFEGTKQSSELVAPILLVSPGTQSTQLIAPGFVLYFPASHFTHAVAPVVALARVPLRISSEASADKS